MFILKSVGRWFRGRLRHADVNELERIDHDGADRRRHGHRRCG
jgi:hypothetical protein